MSPVLGRFWGPSLQTLQKENKKAGSDGVAGQRRARQKGREKEKGKIRTDDDLVSGGHWERAYLRDAVFGVERVGCDGIVEREGREKGGRTEREVESAGERNLFNDVFFCPVVAAAGASQFGGQLRLAQTRLGVGGGKNRQCTVTWCVLSAKSAGGAGRRGEMLGKAQAKAAAASQPKGPERKGKKAGRSGATDEVDQGLE